MSRTRRKACAFAAAAGMACCLLLPCFAGTPAPQAVPDPCLPALKRFIDMQRRATVDDDAFEPYLAEPVRQQAARTQALLSRLGALQSMTFVRRNGAERVYELWFEHGRMFWGVTMSPAGKFANLRGALLQHD